jgi:hypothetical protein
MNKKTVVKRKVNFVDWLRVSLLRITRLHFLLAVFFGVQLFVYDASKLLTADVVMRRWIVIAIFLAGNAGIWYLAHNKQNDIATFKRLIFSLIAVDIFVASFAIYSQRGMASRGVMLYALPIVVSSILLSPSAIFTTAIISAASYIATAVSYFVLNFNEGYKVELYGEVFFYSACFILLGGLLSVVVRFGGDTAER